MKLLFVFILAFFIGVPFSTANPPKLMFVRDGHIVLNSSFFISHQREFRNFLVDLLNHPELFLGALSYPNQEDPNANPFTDKSIWNKIKQKIDAFDKGQVMEPQRVPNLVVALNQILQSNLAPGKSSTGIQLPNAAHSPEDLQKQIQLLQSRYNYILKLNRRENLNPRYPEHATSLDPQKIIEEIHYFISIAGEKWSEHQDYLYPLWIKNGELDRFNNRGIRFGPEFTFSRLDGKNAQEGPLRKHMANHLVQNQPEGAKFEVTHTKFISPHGWFVQLLTDSGSIEVNMNPMNVDEWARYKDDIQDALFVSAVHNELYPALYAGGGHINLDFSYFLDRPLLFRNFIVDLYNHNELFLGVFNYDSANALSWNLVDEKFQYLMRDQIDKLDKSLIEGSYDLRAFASNIDAAHNVSCDPYRKLCKRPHRGKTFAINLRKLTATMGREARIELRAFRPQASADVFYRQIRLLQNRLNYLEKLDDFIPVQPRVAIFDEEVTEDNFLIPPVDPQEALASFHEYLKESGEAWEDHRDYLWPHWITEGEVDRYEKSVGIVPSCSELLTEHL